VYVGLGLGAYGFLLDEAGSSVRYANLGTLENYIEEAMQSSGIGKTDGLGRASTRDILSKLDSAREKMMLGLRMARGAPFEEICDNLPTELKRKWEQMAAKLVTQGLVRLEEGRLRATESGLLIADTLAEEFF
jgi:oxygen-independent coproporphyrinogen-3 oxidase